jgi:glycosyltransferase 2 family protein
MKKQLSAILQYFIFFGGGVALIWWQFHSMTPIQLHQFRFALSTANYWILIPVTLVAAAGYVSRSLRWQLLIEHLGYKTSLSNVFGSLMIGYLINSFVPRLGEIIKCTLLGKYEKIPPQKLIGTIVAERIFDVLCYITFIIITVFIQYKLVGGFVERSLNEMFSSNTGLPVWAKATLYSLLIIGIVVACRLIFKHYAHSSIVMKVKNFFKGLSEGIATIKDLQNKKAFLLHTLLIWTLYVVEIYIAFFSIKETSHLGIGAACSVLTLATLAMIVTPGGIGTFPTAIFLILQLYKIEGSIGEAFGWLMWGATTFIILSLGTISLAVLFHKNKIKEQPVEIVNNTDTI